MNDYRVGKRYPVNAVYAERWYDCYTGWIPVIGSKHEDAKILDFPDDHWHVDWRFLCAHAYRAVTRFVRRPYSSVVMECTSKKYLSGSRRIVTRGPEQRMMTYKRDWPEWPSPETWKGPFKQLREVYADVKMKNMICPHKGIPLHEADCRDGVVTCPGHGLRWCVETGRQVLP